MLDTREIFGQPVQVYRDFLEDRQCMLDQFIYISSSVAVLWSDYTFHLKALWTQNLQCGKPDRFAVNRRAAQRHKNVHMHLYKGIHVLGSPFLSRVASCIAWQAACDRHRNPPFLSVEPDPHGSRQICKKASRK